MLFINISLVQLDELLKKFLVFFALIKLKRMVEYYKNLLVPLAEINLLRNRLSTDFSA